MNWQKMKQWLPILCGIAAVAGLFFPVLVADYYIVEIELNAFSILFDPDVRRLDPPVLIIVLSVVQIVLGIISLIKSFSKKKNTDSSQRCAVILSLIVSVSYMIEGMYLVSKESYYTTMAYIPFIVCVVLAIVYYKAFKKSDN